SVDFEELCIVAAVTIEVDPLLDTGVAVATARTSLPKCDRCRRYLPDVVPATGLCGRCTEVVDAR
ncbi:MAG: zinc finger domain-containing protein, partial [Janthinobacterium lividum]